MYNAKSVRIPLPNILANNKNPNKNSVTSVVLKTMEENFS
jgi:hypothetical protein